VEVKLAEDRRKDINVLNDSKLLIKAHRCHPEKGSSLECKRVVIRESCIG
jgi:hypothetical protein